MLERNIREREEEEEEKGKKRKKKTLEEKKPNTSPGNFVMLEWKVENFDMTDWRRRRNKKESFIS